MAASSGLALGFLRRLLCAHTTADNNASSAPAHTPPQGRSPCIVARLMGLDAMPPADAQPRRTRSLRDKPAYLRPENDMFLLLSFSPEERGTSRKRADDDDVEAERRRESRPHRRRLQFGGGDEAESSGPSSGSARREYNAQQSSSPVSVLDARDESSTATTATSSSLEDVEPCSASSEETRFALEQHSSSSTRKLHTSFVQLDDTSPATSTVHSSRCSDRDRRNRRMVKESEARATDVAGIWQPICTLVEEDLKSMEWVTRDGANIFAEMGSEILDQLICEATVELVQLSSDVPYASPLAALIPKKCKDKTSNWKYILCPRNIQARQRLQAAEHESTDCLNTCSEIGPERI